MTAPTLTHRQAGVAVLLVYGLRVPVPRDGGPGFRLTVQTDGAVHVHPVGYEHGGAAEALDLQIECMMLDLNVSPIPGGFAVSRRSPCPSS